MSGLVDDLTARLKAPASASTSTAASVVCAPVDDFVGRSCGLVMKPTNSIDGMKTNMPTNNDGTDEPTALDQVAQDDPAGMHGVEAGAGIVCSECGAVMPDDAYARMFGRCARHADEEKERGLIGELRAVIEREEDVKRVVELEAIAGGRFRYMIETPFETFPKFVIGTTDAEFADVRLEHRCGAEWNAREIWERREKPPVNLESGVEW